MTRKDLAEIIAEKHDLSKAASEEMIVTLFEEIANGLTGKEEITIPGFGKFTITERSERMGRNPQTKEAIKIPASLAVKFKPAKQLKDSVNNK